MLCWLAAAGLTASALPHPPPSTCLEISALFPGGKQTITMGAWQYNQVSLFATYLWPLITCIFLLLVKALHSFQEELQDYLVSLALHSGNFGKLTDHVSGWPFACWGRQVFKGRLYIHEGRLGFFQFFYSRPRFNFNYVPGWCVCDGSFAGVSPLERVHVERYRTETSSILLNCGRNYQPRRFRIG